MAKLETIDGPSGFLTPAGSAGQKTLLEDAHSCGEFLASKNSHIVCTAPVGEAAVALLTGALSTGGHVKIYADENHNGIAHPEGAERVEVEDDASERCLSEIGYVWAMPPQVADLQRYLDVWINSGFKPLVCVSTRDEFLLLRGFVQDVVSVGCPKAAERLLFVRTVEEGWDQLSELLD